MSRTNAVQATAFVVAHLAIGVIHNVAHDGLGVVLNPSQSGFVNVVYVGLPILAAVLVWTPQARVGAFVLLGSIAGSLVFGVWYHFVFVSPDHVAHLPEGGQRFLFQVTAALMTLIDLGGVWLGWRLVRGSDEGPRP